MDDKSQGAEERRALSERREFLKKAGKAAVTVPAVALLLSMEGKPAQAQGVSGAVTTPG